MFITCLLYGFLLCFCRPVIGPWAFRKIMAKNYPIGARVISATNISRIKNKTTILKRIDSLNVYDRLGLGSFKSKVMGTDVACMTSK